MARIARRTLLAAVLVFVGVFLFRNADEIANYEYSINWLSVLGAFLMATAAYLLNISTWARIANHCGAHASWQRHALVWSTSRLARYLPGKVATIYLRIEGYAGARARASISLYLEITSSLIAACGFILLCWLSGIVSLSGLHVALMAVALTGLGLLSSRHVLGFLADLLPPLQKLIPREALPRYRWWVGTVLLQVLVMLLHGLSLYFVVTAAADLPPERILELTVYYYFAGLAGMLALFAPAGIGVREAVLVGLLQTMATLPVAVVAVALARVVTVVAECALSATFHLLELFTSTVPSVGQRSDLLGNKADKKDYDRSAEQ